MSQAILTALLSGGQKAQISGLDTFDQVTLQTVLATKNIKSGMIALLVDTDSYKTTFTEEYATQQTAAAILTPTTGYSLCIRNVHMATDASTGEIQLDFATSGKKVARLYIAKQTRDWISVGDFSGAVNEPLKLTTTTGTSKVFIMINYIEHPADA